MGTEVEEFRVMLSRYLAMGERVDEVLHDKMLKAFKEHGQYRMSAEMHRRGEERWVLIAAKNRKGIEALTKKSTLDSFLSFLSTVMFTAAIGVGMFVAFLIIIFFLLKIT